LHRSFRFESVASNSFNEALEKYLKPIAIQWRNYVNGLNLLKKIRLFIEKGKYRHKTLFAEYEIDKTIKAYGKSIHLMKNIEEGKISIRRVEYMEITY